jgi:hypothetical protein
VRSGASSGYAPITEAQYIEHLEAMYTQLLPALAPAGTILFCTTTPVPASYKGRNDSSVVTINKLARKLFGPSSLHPHVLVHDLYAEVVNRCHSQYPTRAKGYPMEGDCPLQPNGVHFCIPGKCVATGDQCLPPTCVGSPGKEMTAAFVAEAIRPHLRRAKVSLKTTDDEADGASSRFLEAGSALVQWSGRTVRGAHGAVQFEWLGVSARVSVSNATWVSVIATTAAPTMGTRLRAYTSDQGFGLYPLVSFWVSPHAAGNETLLFVIDNSSLGDRTITIENLMDQKYATTIHGFRTDGTFVPDLNPLPVNRNMEFIGDSITAATTVSLLLNIVRPPGAPACADHDALQSDWSKSYAALLCHRFGASCSTVAVGGKCLMSECGGLQMPDYYRSALISDAPNATYNFSSTWKPNAVFVDLGTNDERVIHGMKTQHPNGSALFVSETVAFLHSIQARYNGGVPRSSSAAHHISFFLAAGPIRNMTARSSRAVPVAVAKANEEGLDVTFVDLTTACDVARQHGSDNADHCDGCSAHPGIQGHYEMAQLSYPIIAQKMGWTMHSRSTEIKVRTSK